jgi:hypothetical protein
MTISTVAAVRGAPKTADPAMNGGTARALGVALSHVDLR